ncbi:alpha/beta fold hydrolase [Sphingobium sp.]|uniref:alpha/beta fold hydrolase n=1 Tax=Sphingobium sp. TaxID=1912891 RepID=UPI003BB50174
MTKDPSWQTEIQTVVSHVQGGGQNVVVTETAGSQAGATIVLMHGGGQTRHSWGTALRTFAAAGYRTIAYDARGHGESQWAEDGDYTFAALAADLKAILKDVEGPVALVGASMGGIAAYRAIGDGLVRASALVLVDIVPNPAQRGGERIVAFMTCNRDGFASVDEAADAVSAYYPERQRPNDISGLRKNLRLRPDGRLGWHWDPRLFGNGPTTEPPDIASWAIDMASSVTLPVLLVRGGASDVVDAEAVTGARKLLPQLEVLEVPGAGHMIVGDQNDAFNAGVLDFVGRYMPSR